MVAVKVQSLFNIGTGQENGKQFIFSNAYERYAFARTLLGGSVPDQTSPTMMKSPSIMEKSCTET